MDPMPTMPDNRSPVPGEKACDPIAAALGNASLLGIGYALLGRLKLAIGAAVISVLLLSLLAWVGQPGWVYVVLFLWWAAVTAHGGYLARRSGQPDGVRTQRLVALGAVFAMLLAFGALRVDAWRIERNAAAAHANNECSKALSALDGLWAGHRVADPSLAGRTKDSVEACELLLRADELANGNRLRAAEKLQAYAADPAALWKGAEGRRAELFLAQATADLDIAWTGYIEALEAGFDNLATVLEEYPSRTNEVDEVLDGFLDGLPVKDACDTRRITDWLGNRPTSENELDRASDIVPQIAPTAIVECGDSFMAIDEPDQARDEYEQLLDQYPDHDLVDRAERGAAKAKLAVQLANVRRLLEPTYGYGKPAYCRNPAPYGGAEPYRGGGPYRTMMFGNGGNKQKLPSTWLTDDPAKAVLVICAGDVEFGGVVETCPYERSSGGGGTYYVSFRNRKIPVRVYELRTGKRVADSSVQIGGESCPYFISFFGSPPPNRYVDSDKYDVREAYGEVIDP